MEELGSSNGDDGAGAVGARARGEKESETERTREERMASALGAMVGEGEGAAPVGRACRPRGVVALTRLGARGAAVVASGRTVKVWAWGPG